METQYRNYDAPKAPQQVTITWRMETPRDDSGDAPDERQDGFWPSHDKSAAGYVPPELYDDEQEKAEARMDAWRADEWEYVGVVAVAIVAIPIGQGCFVTHEFRSAGLWGIESDSGDYLREIYQEQKDELLSQLKQLGAALTENNFVERAA